MQQRRNMTLPQLVRQCQQQEVAQQPSKSRNYRTLFKAVVFVVRCQRAVSKVRSLLFFMQVTLRFPRRSTEEKMMTSPGHLCDAQNRSDTAARRVNACSQRRQYFNSTHL